MLINEFTKSFSSNRDKADIIQCALEYNYFLIKELVENKQGYSKSEFDHTLILLWENLKKLAKNVDSHLKISNLRKDTKYNKLYSDYKKLVLEKEQKEQKEKKEKKEI